MTKFTEANLRIFINIIVKEEVDDCSYLCLPAFFPFLSTEPDADFNIWTAALFLDNLLVSGAEDTSAQFSRRSPNSTMSYAPHPPQPSRQHSGTHSYEWKGLLSLSITRI